jgi:hypothetical protein
MQTASYLMQARNRMLRALGRNYECGWRPLERAATLGAPLVFHTSRRHGYRNDPLGAARRTLHLAFDLGNRIWTLAFATSVAPAPRLRTMSARNLAQLDTEIAAAKARFGLAPDAPVVSCYEAGRDGFWLHRALAPAA